MAVTGTLHADLLEYCFAGLAFHELLISGVYVVKSHRCNLSTPA